MKQQNTAIATTASRTGQQKRQQQQQPRLNKYHTKAVREELESYIRYKAWNKFRLRFRELLQASSDDDDSSRCFCRAVIDFRTTTRKSTVSLLHLLCDRYGSSSSIIVPIDLLQLVGGVAPDLFLVPGKKTTSTTPLSLFVEKGAPVEFLKWVLSQQQQPTDRLQEYLLHDDGLVQKAIQKECALDVVRLLVESSNPVSLLCKNKKGHTPLSYLVNKALKETTTMTASTKHLPDNNNNDERFGVLAYILMETQRAVASGIQQQKRRRDDQDDESYPSSLPSQCTRNRDDGNTLLRASIDCAHLIRDGNNDCTTVVRFLQYLSSRWPETTTTTSSVVDDQRGNTLLHHAVKLKYSSLDPKPLRGLLEFLITLHPMDLLVYNHSGKLPLHVAIEQVGRGHQHNTTTATILQLLYSRAPESLKIRTTRSNYKSSTKTSSGGRLALHLGIVNHRSPRDDGKSRPLQTLSTDDIRNIWNAYPEASLVPDPLYDGLYPFQALATTIRSDENEPSTSSSSSSSGDDDNDDRLSLVYTMLRRAPQVLQWTTRLDATRRYGTRRYGTMTKETTANP